MVRQPPRPGRESILAIACVAVDLVLFSTLLNGADPAATPAGVLIGYAVVGGLVLLARRRVPVVVYTALWLHAIGSVALTGYRPTVPLLIVLYTVAAYAGGRAGLAALVATAGPIGLAVADGVGDAPPNERTATLVGLGLLLAIIHSGAYGIGRWVRSSRRRADALEQDRDSAARDAVEVERVRIAHELHDTVAHSVTVMTLQAAGAKTLVRRDPDRAEEALTHVGGAGVAAMSELRRMLTALRADGSTGPGLHSVDDLVAGVRTAGVDVSVDCDGEPARPAPAADLAAYRVIQEALTNVAKHAGPGTRATVTMRWLPGRLQIEVTDDGAGRPTGDAAGLSTGHGLAGLAERIAGLGGRLEAGAAPGTGFRVSATVPMEDAGARAAG